ncbi:MAG TPA: hypothetical protein VL494_13850 [Steroidobacteraceae bacterium]|nr:hypothetical protein [Steroidobacteraceae bacterium]
MTRDAIVELLKDAGEELLPVIGKAIQGLIAGKPPEQVLSQAERDILADQAEKRLDAALHHKPIVPGSGV